MHGKEVDLSTLGVPPDIAVEGAGFTDLTEDQQESGAFWLPVKAYTGNPTVAFT